jgi:Holliday junction resolvase RusA-like endonuclease
MNYETLVKELYILQHNGTKLNGQVEMHIKAYFNIPKSKKPTAKKPKLETLKKYQDLICGRVRHTTKPDWDNVGKIISDALNGLAYDDDSQIVSATVEKFYSDNPRVEIEISTISTAT